jgi:LPS-assembly lipoprotein
VPRRRSAIALVAAVTAGCGFELRRAPELPFRSVALVGFSDQTRTGHEVRRALVPEVTVVEQPSQADVVLEALTDERRRGVSASTSAGQVREVLLQSRLVYRLSTRDGRVLLPPVEVLRTRGMDYAESEALAKQYEEEILWRAMEADIAAQVVRRLAATPRTG